MNIIYLNHTRFPSERAHGHQVASVCDALQSLGHAVTIAAPSTYTSVTSTACEYYGISPHIDVQYIEHFDPWSMPMIPEFCKNQLTTLLYRRALKKHLRKAQNDLQYLRSPALLSACSDRSPIVLELHTLPTRGRQKFLHAIKRCALVVCLTSPMERELKEWGYTGKTVVASDAVDLQKFKEVSDSAAIRNQYGIQYHVQLVGYAGQLHSMGLSKGVEDLLEAVQLLQQHNQDVHLVIAGGPEDVRKQFEAQYANAPVTFVGTLERSAVPHLIRACDLLVYPAPQSDHAFYQRDTSPLKLFEYMATGVPIVCADIPPVHDVVDETMVTFYEPGNVQSLCQCMHSGFGETEKAAKAKGHVMEHTWEKRMERILNTIESSLVH